MESKTTSSDEYTPIITKYLEIESVIWGTEKQGYIVRYQGALKIDSGDAHDELQSHFDDKNLSVLFRLENELPTIILKKKVVRGKNGNAATNLVLFLLTLISMIIAGALYAAPSDFGADGVSIISSLIAILPSGIPFAVSLLAILTAHEFGHYFVAKYHNSDVSLPYFLPFPLSPFGTLGAFIMLKAAPKNRKVLHDIGVAGPLAGLLVTIPVLFYGLSLSSLNPLPTIIPEGISISLEGNSIFYLISKYMMFDKWLPTPPVSDINPGFFYWIKYFFTGTPIPLGGIDVYLHPIAWAGWAGLLVTSLNLIPVGQLDGGHIIYVLLGEKTKKILPFVMFSMFFLGFVWQGWWFWLLIIWFSGRSHAQPNDQITPLDKNRKIIACLMLLVFLLIFMPIPLNFITGPFTGL